MSVIKAIKNAVDQKKKTVENQVNNRKSTDTRVNSGKPAARAKPRTVYYRSKDDAKPVYRNPAKKAAVRKPSAPKTVYYKTGGPSAAQSPTRKLTWNDELEIAAAIQNDINAEMYPNWWRTTGRNPLAWAKRDATPGSAHWRKQSAKVIKGMIDQTEASPEEDRGTTLSQAKRLAALYGAVDPVTQGFSRDYSGELHKQIQNAPVDLQELYIRYGDELSPAIDMQSGNAYYSPFEGRVHINSQYIDSRPDVYAPGSVLWHEYGHNLDDLAEPLGNYSAHYTNYSQPHNFNELAAKDWDQSLRRYWSNAHGDTPYNDRVAREEFSAGARNLYKDSLADVSPLSDMFAPYSLDHGGSSYPITVGHDPDYYSSQMRRNAEFFANMSDTAVLGGEKERLARTFLPETYDAYLAMLADMAYKR